MLPDPVGEIDRFHGAARMDCGSAKSVSPWEWSSSSMNRVRTSQPMRRRICVKSGNAVILRGGKEAAHSSQAIVRS